MQTNLWLIPFLAEPEKTPAFRQGPPQTHGGQLHPT